VKIPVKAVEGGVIVNTDARIFWEDVPYGLCILKVKYIINNLFKIFNTYRIWHRCYKSTHLEPIK
jgi:hypothetical protein